MKILVGALALLLTVPAFAQREAQFGVPQTFHFRLFNADGTLDIDEADSGTEVTVMCNEGAPATATNDFVDEGTAYAITLTAAEMRCARIEVHIGATVANSFFIETFGDLLAQDKTRGIASGVAQSGTATTIVLASATSIADDYPNNAVIQLTGGTGAGQRRLITDWTNTTPADTATVSAAWGTNPASGTEYIIHPVTQASLSELGTHLNTTVGLPTLAQVQNELTSLATGDDVNDLSTTIGTPTISIAGDIATAQSGQDLIKAKTDQLTFGVTGKVDANTTHMNEVAICGDGGNTAAWTGVCP